MASFDVPGADGPPIVETLHDNFLFRLPIDGASVTVVSAAGNAALVSASDELARRLEQAQNDLGEGPHVRALQLYRPVLVADVRSADHTSWPVFWDMVTQTPARALFAFPMRVGAAVVGVVDLYRRTPGTLSDFDVMIAGMLAGAVAGKALALAAIDAGEGAAGDGRDVPGIRRHVHQAVGMVAVQLNTTVTEAFARLRAYAYAADRTVDDVARDVVTHALDFTETPPLGGTDGQR